MSGDLLAAIVGIVLVAAAAAFALLPFMRASRSVDAAIEDSSPDRLGLYRQVLELEFDFQLGKLSSDDYDELSGRLLTQAGQALRQERGNLAEIDAEIEREIAAARAAFVAVRESVRTPVERVG